VILDRVLVADATWSSRLSLANRPGWLRTMAALLAHSGDSWFWLAGLVIIYLVGDAFWKSWSLMLGAAIIALAGTVLVIKFTFRRRRPEGEWGAIYRKTDPHSFPSGHAARSALIAVLSLAWGPPWLALVLVIWAPLVSIARVALGVHFLSDVVAGALIGIGAGFLAASLV
jgi:undecaprenyl-diphosphatase